MSDEFKKYLIAVGLCCGMVIAGCFIFSRTTGAYTVGSGQGLPVMTTGTAAGYLKQAQELPWFSGAWTAVSQWFQNIMAQGAQSTGAPAVPITLSGPLGSTITVSAQNLFAQFDAWLYSIVHFHIALVFNFLFGLVGWILGIAKNIVDWMNSIFKSAAGR